MIFFRQIVKSLIKAVIMTLMWAGCDALFSADHPWHYGEVFAAMFGGGMLAGPWTKKEAREEIVALNDALSAADGAKP